MALAAILTLAVLVVAGVMAYAGSLVLARPVPDPVTSADAVVLLSGDQGGRLPLALRLIDEQVAPTLVIDGVADLPEAKELCRDGAEFEVVCLSPEPDRTRTEARAAGRLARERGWRRLVVVTDPAHFARARLLFDRCVDGEVAVVGVTPPVPHTRRLGHEWLGILHALVISRGC